MRHNIVNEQFDALLGWAAKLPTERRTEPQPGTTETRYGAREGYGGWSRCPVAASLSKVAGR